MNAGLRTAMAVDGDAARSALTASERQRCASLSGTEQQGNFRAGRLAAKRAAKETLHRHEARIEVVPRAGAGPTLAVLDRQGQPHDTDIVVSIAHRDGRAVAAAARVGWHVGVDLERVRAIPTHLGRHFLASDEARASGRDITVLWALKEAAWKALGLGRSVPFKDVELLCDASGRLGGVSVCGSAMRMSSYLSTPWPGYVMAVVWSEGGTA